MKAACPVCNEGMTDSGIEMHEALLTRGDVQGCNDEVKAAIMVRENCVIVHSGACHIAAQTKRGKLLCAKHLLLYEGFTHIEEWLIKMKGLMRTTQPFERINLISELMLSLQLQKINPADLPAKYIFEEAQ